MKVMPSTRPLFLFGVLGSLVFAATFACSYVYYHAPQQPIVNVDIAHATPIESSDEFVEGVVIHADHAMVTVETNAEILEVPITDIVLEELQLLDNPKLLSPGMPLNIGGQRLANTHVIHGVVIFDLASNP